MYTWVVSWIRKSRLYKLPVYHEAGKVKLCYGMTGRRSARKGLIKQGPAGGSCASCDDGHGASESGSSYANAQAMFADPLPSAHRPEGTTSSVVGEPKTLTTVVLRLLTYSDCRTIGLPASTVLEYNKVHLSY